MFGPAILLKPFDYLVIRIMEQAENHITRHLNGNFQAVSASVRFPGILVLLHLLHIFIARQNKRVLSAQVKGVFARMVKRSFVTLPDPFQNAPSNVAIDTAYRVIENVLPKSFDGKFQESVLNFPFPTEDIFQGFAAEPVAVMNRCAHFSF